MTAARLQELLRPFHGSLGVGDRPEPSRSAVQLDPLAGERLLTFLELLLRWNARTNLTAIREPEEIVRRHFGESLFLATSLRELLQPGTSVLDFGSGAGFPGIPLQIFAPALHVTLAESQGKKAAFLREAARTLNLSAEVWADRVEKLPADRVFDLVTMRAVDRWPEALCEAEKRVAEGGTLALLTGEELPTLSSEFECSSIPLPDSHRRYLRLCRR